MLNNTEKKTLIKCLKKMHADEAKLLDRLAQPNKLRTQSQLKNCAARAYKVHKSIDFLLQNLK